MNITSTIEFKSVSEFFDKERAGTKNNTVRFVNEEEDKKISSIINDIKYIRIVNTDNRTCTPSFVRTLTDITKFESDGLIDGLTIYIFSW